MESVLMYKYVWMFEMIKIKHKFVLPHLNLKHHNGSDRGKGTEQNGNLYANYYLPDTHKNAAATLLFYCQCSRNRQKTYTAAQL